MYHLPFLAIAYGKYQKVLWGAEMVTQFLLCVIPREQYWRKSFSLG
jgi:hypothetical protein